MHCGRSTAKQHTATDDQPTHRLSCSLPPFHFPALPSFPQFVADLSTLSGVNQVSSTLALLGVSALHVLVNNSGASWGEPLSSFSEKGWDRVMDLNVKSLFFLTRALLPLLSAAASAASPARVINIGSVTGIGHQRVPSWSYDVSKAAVHHLTVKLAEELGKQNITVNAIAPGYGSGTQQHSSGPLHAPSAGGRMLSSALHCLLSRCAQCPLR